MSELRHDPLSRRWVIIAEERANRPMDFEMVVYPPKLEGPCPFCAGSESLTPPEITALREDGSARDGPGWSARVVPNRYPALAIEGTPDRRGVGVYDRMHGIGAHEVLIDSPHHDRELADQPLEHVVKLLGVWRERLLDLQRDSSFKYVLLFKNKGAAAGASLEHPHAQIVATPVTPRAVAVELDACRSHHELKERCLLCDMVAQELEDGRRIVSLDEQFVAWAPYASRFPFELLIAPRRHAHDFGLLPDDLLMPLARILSDVLGRLKAFLRDVPYNLVLHSAPNTHVQPRRAHYFTSLEHDWHWHLEVLPRITRVAGFEWGTDFHINPTPPEEAARLLREAAIGEGEP